MLAGPISPALAQDRHVGLKIGVNVASNVVEGQDAGECDERRLELMAGVVQEASFRLSAVRR